MSRPSVPEAASWVALGFHAREDTPLEVWVFVRGGFVQRNSATLRGDDADPYRGIKSTTVINALLLSSAPVWPDSSTLNISPPPKTSDSRFLTPSIPSGDDVFGTLFEKLNLVPLWSELVLRLATSSAIPPSAFTPLQTPELMSTAPFTAVSIIAADVKFGRGFEVA